MRVVAVKNPDSQTPPWLCEACRRGWWDTEVTDPRWDSDLGGYPAGVAVHVVAACEAEQAAG